MQKRICTYRSIKDLLVLTLSFSCISFASGEPVFKSNSPTGKSPMYTTKPSSQSQPANLPPIVRTDSQGKTFVRQTCHSHGGIDCGAGPDKDGSVICYDKYRDTGERFNFSCTAPKLEIANISRADAPFTFKVLVRNNAAAEAKGIKVNFKPEIGGSFKLIGSESIKGFESGEYSYKPLDEFHKFSPPDPSKLEITCSNCP